MRSVIPWLWQRLRLALSTVRAKLILPYVLLTLAVAFVGSLIATRLATTSARERFSNQLAEARRVAADGIVRKERAHLESLRLMVFTLGVAEALAIDDLETLQDRLLPILFNDNIQVASVINRDGRDMLTFTYDAQRAQYQVSNGVDFSDFEPVAKVLNGVVDEYGDKFSGLLSTPRGPYLFTVAPVYTDDQVIGAMMVGTSLPTLLAELKAQSLADIIVLDPNGKLLATTLAEPDEGYQLLEMPNPFLENSGAPASRNLQLYGRPYESLPAPLEVRQRSIGILEAVLPSDYLFDVQSLSRNSIGVIFASFTIAIIVLGYLLAQLIVRPILRLRTISQAVAAGDLNQSTGLKLSDEIGELARAFDVMTDRLRERTEVAMRLHAETVQRNQELAEANAQLRATQQQLIQSEKMAAIGQLAAGIVHDVKNPLAGAMGLAELMAGEQDLDDQHRQTLALITENVRRANRIVSELMKFARQSSLEMMLGDLRTTVETVLRLTSYMAREAGVTVRTDLPAQPVLIHYDAQLIEQVIVNLVQNAFQAMPNGGVLDVSIRITDAMVALTVRDTGIGIRPEHLHRIFDPFFTTKPVGEGTGLGLSVSYGIVSSHGGRIDVESVVGEGTAFTVWLPLNPPKHVQANGNRLPKTGASQLKTS